MSGNGTGVDFPQLPGTGTRGRTRPNGLDVPPSACGCRGPRAQRGHNRGVTPVQTPPEEPSGAGPAEIEGAFVFLEALEDARYDARRSGGDAQYHVELVQLIHELQERLGFEESGVRVTASEILLPTEVARRVDVPTRRIVQAMHEKRIARVRLSDGTLGIPPAAAQRFDPGA